MSRHIPTRAHAGIEFLQPEVDGVGPVLNRGARALPVACGREQLWNSQERMWNVEHVRILAAKFLFQD